MADKPWERDSHYAHSADSMDSCRNSCYKVCKMSNGDLAGRNMDGIPVIYLNKVTTRVASTFQTWLVDLSDEHFRDSSTGVSCSDAPR